MKNSKLILAVLTSLLFCLFITLPLGVGYGLALFAVDIVAAATGLIPGGVLLSACGVVAAQILFDCVNPVVGGTVPVLYITNREDITAMTKNVSNALIVEGITMVALKKFYKLEGRNDGDKGSSVAPSWKTVKLSYGKAYEHLVDAQSFKVDPATKKELEAWNLADVVIIVENKFRNGTVGNTAYEIYGAEGGLQMEEMSRNPNDVDSMGVIKLQFKSQQTSLENHMPYTFFLTDYATTKALVAALIV